MAFGGAEIANGIWISMQIFFKNLGITTATPATAAVGKWRTLKVPNSKSDEQQK
jgi:hypothetical protein